MYFETLKGCDLRFTEDGAKENNIISSTGDAKSAANGGGIVLGGKTTGGTRSGSQTFPLAGLDAIFFFLRRMALGPKMVTETSWVLRKLVKTLRKIGMNFRNTSDGSEGAISSYEEKEEKVESTRNLLVVTLARSSKEKGLIRRVLTYLVNWYPLGCCFRLYSAMALGAVLCGVQLNLVSKIVGRFEGRYRQH